MLTAEYPFVSFGVDSFHSSSMPSLLVVSLPDSESSAMKSTWQDLQWEAEPTDPLLQCLDDRALTVRLIQFSNFETALLP